jgi:hypothetical protein
VIVADETDADAVTALKPEEPEGPATADGADTDEDADEAGGVDADGCIATAALARNC